MRDKAAARFYDSLARASLWHYGLDHRNFAIRRVIVSYVRAWENGCMSPGACAGWLFAFSRQEEGWKWLVYKRSVDVKVNFRLLRPG